MFSFFGEVQLSNAIGLLRLSLTLYLAINFNSPFLGQHENFPSYFKNVLRNDLRIDTILIQRD